MKSIKIILGGIGFLSLIGTIWGLAIIVFVGKNLTSSWPTPPGRFLTTVIELNMVTPMVIVFIFLIFGLIVMGVEYFKKEN